MLVYRFISNEEKSKTESKHYRVAMHIAHVHKHTQPSIFRAKQNERALTYPCQIKIPKFVVISLKL